MYFVMSIYKDSSCPGYLFYHGAEKKTFRAIKINVLLFPDLTQSKQYIHGFINKIILPRYFNDGIKVKQKPLQNNYDNDDSIQKISRVPTKQKYSARIPK